MPWGADDLSAARSPFRHLGRDVTRDLGATDCEALGTGAIAQPVLALTSMAYIIAGVWLLSLRRTRGADGQWFAVAYAVSLGLVGVGSILFHGPQWAGSKWLHDAPIVVAIAVIPVWGARSAGLLTSSRARATWIVVSVVAGLAAAVADAALLAVGAVVGLAAVVAEAWARRGRQIWLFVIGVGASAGALNLLGRTGAPLCNPDSVVQWHGAWHVLTALAFALWGRVALFMESPSGAQERVRS